MTDGGTKIITLTATLDFPAAAALAEEFREQQLSPTLVDASGVQHLGALCLQVLLAAAKTWRADAVSLRVENLSLAFSEGLTRMGITVSDLSHDGGAA